MKKSITILLLFVSCSIYAQDIFPPQITGITISPPLVDVLAGTDTVVISITAVDSASGLSNVAVGVASPNDIHDANGSATFEAGSKSGTIECPIEIKEFSESGTWFIENIFIFDQAGNYAEIKTFDLLTLGLTTTFEVISNQDILGPILTLFAVLPPAVNVTFGDESLDFTIAATDDVSGLKVGAFCFKSPLGFHEVNAHVEFDAGSFADEVSGSITFGQFTENGTWRLDYLTLTDVIGNETRLNGFILQALGFPSTINVVSLQDVAPPVLTFFGVDPPIIDGSAGTTTAAFTVSATDNISGLSQATVVLESPSGDSYVTAYGFFDETLIGTLTIDISITEFTELGIWTVSSIYLRDVIGNDENYTTLLLQMMGITITVTVLDNVIPPPPVPTDALSDQIPADFVLLQNYPNPFNPTTTIEYHLPQAANIEISLYNMLGEKMKALYTGNQSAGIHRLSIDAAGLSSGIYFYELKSNEFREIKKCLLLQ